MSDTSEQPWSDGPNPPQVPFWLHIAEKEEFAGLFIGMILYGILIALFFQCMSVLLSPVNSSKRGINWGLVAHTVAMFSFVTISFGIYLNGESIRYINTREYPGDDGNPPGPLGYTAILNTQADVIVREAMFHLNQWLSDGLLLHRCYIIYAMDYWVMAFPCLAYLSSIAIGAAYIYQQSEPGIVTPSLGSPYYSISFGLNVLLTLMIIVRLAVHIRNVRKAIGALDTSSRLYRATATVITMLIESCAIYALALLTFLVCSVAQSWAFIIIAKPLCAIQVIAPYLIIVRVANRKALTSETVSGTSESIRFRGQSQATTDDGSTLPDENDVDSMEVNGVGEAPGELGAGTEDAIEEIQSQWGA